MAVLRKEKRGHFTVIDNAIFCNYNLSLKAKGLLCQMLSLPDGWEFSVEGLTKLSTDGRSAVTSALTELEEHGYFYRKEVRENGKFKGIEYVISEVQIAEKPITENPISEKPISENPQQLNTKELITKSSITKGIYIAEFETLWKLYPRKQGKDKAYKSYEKARMKGTTYQEVEQGIHAYVAYIEAEHIDSKYIKMGSTFFSQKAWEDDYEVHEKSSGNPFMDMLRNGDY